MTHGPNHDFGGPITLRLHHTPLQQALAALEAHQAARPEYLPKARFDHPQNEAWRRWAREKEVLQTAVEVARALEPRPVLVLTPNPQPKAKRGQGRRLTAQGLLATVHKSIERMNALEPGSKEWLQAQNAAYHNRAQAAKRAREDGETIILPEIPKRRAAQSPSTVSRGVAASHARCASQVGSVTSPARTSRSR